MTPIVQLFEKWFLIEIIIDYFGNEKYYVVIIVRYKNWRTNIRFSHAWDNSRNSKTYVYL